ncbi:MAG: GNAT family N-acyltransferase [Rhodospirillaceae bacterium]|nr:GNAT family N-acyltransferase [Rhodospirillaceae bacterium]
MTLLTPTAVPTSTAGLCQSPEFRPVTAGDQTIRLATSAADIDAAQALRYRVFYEEMGARPTPAMAAAKRDVDAFDGVCEHLIVEDVRESADRRVVGTYRFMRREHAAVAGGFYSAGEFDVSPLLRFPGAVMELGRSCVDAAYRDRSTMQLLWRGIAEYVMAHRIDIMFGCGSLPGTDPDAHAQALTYLYCNHLAPEDLRPRALDERRVEMRRADPERIDARRALAALPPLLKGYLRVGGFVGDGAVIDHEFNTTDVCIVVKTDLIAGRYTRHYDLGPR